MDAVELARWQFGITTVYHYFFVPITIGLSALVALMHTFWYKTRKPEWLRLTKFYGKLFLINFALGVATGIVQEFQFGMNWSDYSRFVGDIFGAPLAVEALLAFFMESTFLGVWVFGWGRINEKIHLAAIWLAALGTTLSAYFILAANSFMQNPVGYKFNPETGRAELTDFFAVLTNKVQLATFPHTISAAFMTGGAFVLAVALWHIWRQKFPEQQPMYRKAAKLGAWTTLLASLAVMGTGHFQGAIMTEVQPMKMAAAEAHYKTNPEGTCANFSIFTTGDADGRNAKHWIQVPCLLGILGHNDPKASVQGIDDLEAQYDKGEFRHGQAVPEGLQERFYKVDSYTPQIPVAYWTFRLMIGLGLVGTLISLLTLLALRGKNAGTGRLRGPAWLWMLMSQVVLFLPLFANSFGWIFTEMGRQPWLVFGLMATPAGVSPGVSATEVLVSMIAFTLLYGVLAVVEVGLTLKYIKAGAPAYEEPVPAAQRDADAPLVFTY